jgi:hypothetical protein
MQFSISAFYGEFRFESHRICWSPPTKTILCSSSWLISQRRRTTDFSSATIISWSLFCFCSNSFVCFVSSETWVPELLISGFEIRFCELFVWLPVSWKPPLVSVIWNETFHFFHDSTRQNHHHYNRSERNILMISKSKFITDWLKLANWRTSLSFDWFSN